MGEYRFSRQGPVTPVLVEYTCLNRYCTKLARRCPEISCFNTVALVSRFREEPVNDPFQAAFEQIRIGKAR